MLIARVCLLAWQAVGNGWEANVAQMILPRYRHALAAVGGRLYACGGQKTDGRATDSVERYDPHADSWTEVAPMGQPRFSHAVAELDGMLCAPAQTATSLPARSRPSPAHSTPPASSERGHMRMLTFGRAPAPRTWYRCRRRICQWQVAERRRAV